MDDIQYVFSHLVRRENLFRAKAVLSIVLGIPLSFLGPLVLATAFWLVCRRFGFLPTVNWTQFLVLMTVVSVPLLYHLEVKTQGKYFADAGGVTGARPAPGWGFVFGSWSAVLPLASVFASPRTFAKPVVEWFLAGPRLFLGGIGKLRLITRLGNVSRERAAQIVATLRRREAGMLLGRLRHDKESLDDVRSYAAYLVLQDWVGVSRDWQRVWLYSASRRTLAPS